ncbi:hypothetical protein [Terasakiella sp. SH-1]|uniref:hypothetical protein n=1 Tax=Terasakiella sp. SH-1 TaxID=2560057 RepID=UPI00107496DD|nr:hypothetical protein [Terasakiella sp. SH-1]
MFGFSPNKLLFTVLVIAAIWYGFKWFSRFQARQEENRANPPQEKTRAQAAQQSSSEADYEELVACSKCGDYVIADKKSACGKAGCPFEK